MKKLKQIIKEDDFSVIKHHVKNSHIGTLSAQKGNLSPDENARRHKFLSDDLKKLGLHHFAIKGRSVEGDKHVDEDSYFVHGGESLLGHLKNLGQKYNQESILHKGPNEHIAKLHGTNPGFPGEGKTMALGAFYPNMKGDTHSITKNGKSFTFANPEEISKAA